MGFSGAMLLFFGGIFALAAFRRLAAHRASKAKSSGPYGRDYQVKFDT